MEIGISTPGGGLKLLEYNFVSLIMTMENEIWQFALIKLMRHSSNSFAWEKAMKGDKLFIYTQLINKAVSIHMLSHWIWPWFMKSFANSFEWSLCHLISFVPFVIYKWIQAFQPFQFQLIWKAQTNNPGSLGKGSGTALFLRHWCIGSWNSLY